MHLSNLFSKKQYCGALSYMYFYLFSFSTSKLIKNDKTDSEVSVLYPIKLHKYEWWQFLIYFLDIMKVSRVSYHEYEVKNAV